MFSLQDLLKKHPAHHKLSREMSFTDDFTNIEFYKLNWDSGKTGM